MPYLPTRMPKLLVLAASAAFSVFLFASSGQADAAPVQGLNGLASPALPVEQAGYYRRQYRSYNPNYATERLSRRLRSYGYYGNGHDEIRGAAKAVSLDQLALQHALCGLASSRARRRNGAELARFLLRLNFAQALPFLVTLCSVFGATWRDRLRRMPKRIATGDEHASLFAQGRRGGLRARSARLCPSQCDAAAHADGASSLTILAGDEENSEVENSRIPLQITAPPRTRRRLRRPCRSGTRKGRMPWRRTRRRAAKAQNARWS